MLTTPEIPKSNRKKPLYFEGGRIGVKNARIGSVVFAAWEAISGFINSLQLIDNDNVLYSTIHNIASTLLWLGLVLLFGIALSTLPAFLGGNLLFIVSQRKSNPRPMARWRFTVFGAILGLLAGILISLIVFTFDYFFWLLNSHISLHAGDSPITTIFLLRAGVATIIATLTGGWTGKQIAEHIEKNYSM